MTSFGRSPDYEANKIFSVRSLLLVHNSLRCTALRQVDQK